MNYKQLKRDVEEAGLYEFPRDERPKLSDDQQRTFLAEGKRCHQFVKGKLGTWSCTRGHAHFGPHVACQMDGTVVAAWSVGYSEEPEPESESEPEQTSVLDDFHSQAELLDLVVALVRQGSARSPETLWSLRLLASTAANCGARHEQFVCTLPVGHGGYHIGGFTGPGGRQEFQEAWFDKKHADRKFSKWRDYQVAFAHGDSAIAPADEVETPMWHYESPERQCGETAWGFTCSLDRHDEHFAHEGRHPDGSFAVTWSYETVFAEAIYGSTKSCGGDGRQTSMLALDEDIKESCGEGHPEGGLRCTREPGHSGPHVAHGLRDRFYADWFSEPGATTKEHWLWRKAQVAIEVGVLTAFDRCIASPMRRAESESEQCKETSVLYEVRCDLEAGHSCHHEWGTPGEVEEVWR